MFGCVWQVHVVLKLWKSGFSLDEGDLRNYSDPGNSLFLESIRRGYVSLTGHFLGSTKTFFFNLFTYFFYKK